MQSSAPDVDSYLDEAPADRRDALRRLREVFAENLTGYREHMAYGMPCYARADDPEAEVEFGFASQKQHLSVYVLRDDLDEALAARVDELVTRPGIDRGKGCLRFRRAETVDVELIGDILRDLAAKPASAC